MSKAAQEFLPEAYCLYVEGGNSRRTPLIEKRAISEPKFLAAFIKATKVTHHTSLFKADRLAAFGTFLTQQAVLGLMVTGGIF